MIGHLLTHTVDVYRPSKAQDAVGGFAETFSLVAEDVDVMPSQPTSEEQRIAAQGGATLDYVLYALSTQDIRRGDELAGQLPSPTNVVQRVKVIAVVRNSRTTYTRLNCQVIQRKTGGA